MPRSLPTRTLAERPDLDQLKRQAKELLDAFRARQPEAVAEVTAHYHDADSATFALHDAQLVIARAYGFQSWPKLKAYVEGVTAQRFHEAVPVDVFDLLPDDSRAVRPQHPRTSERRIWADDPAQRRGVARTRDG